MRRPLAIACNSRDIDEASGWCKEATGAAPDLFYLVGKNSERRDITEATATELRADPSVAVVIFAKNPRGLAINLATQGIAQVSFHQSPGFRNVKGDPLYLKKNAEPLEMVFELLADEESRLTYASVVKQRITGDHNFLRIAPYPEYFHPSVLALNGEWVVDGGASNGGTSIAFATVVGKTGIVHAFEPDPSNVEKIRSRLAKHQDLKLTIHPAALGAERGSMRFASGAGGSSKLTSEGNIEVPITTLDDLATNAGLNGSGLISLDVEGFEEEVLRGGFTMLNRLRPKLQISIYHHMHDLFSLPLWVVRKLGGYRLFVGHHDAYHSETDLYAVPE